MNKNSIIDFLGFAIIKVIGMLFQCMPLMPALWIGRRMGDLAYLVNSKRRSIAYANLKSAFPEKTSCEIKKINRTHFQNLAMSVVELFKLPVMGGHYLTGHTEVKNFERIDKALEKGKGVIILGGHFGNWEMASLAISSKGYRMSVFAREQKYPRLNNLLNSYREMTGCKVIAKGFSVREIIKTLNGNGIVAMLADQDAGPKGVFVKFLGRLASTASGVIAFSKKTGAVILPVPVRRIVFDKHEVTIERPVELIYTGDDKKDTKINLQNISSIFEDYVRKHPEQWLWSHKRWKSTTERRVLVLNDGKKGHFNQSMAIAEMIKEALDSRLNARGIEERAVVSIDAVDLRFKNRFTRALLDMASLFAGRRCQGCLRCLRFFLEKESFEKIKGYADIIVSTGASTIAANILLKYENNARNIVVMKPGLGRSNKFDLLILPKHDAPRKIQSNILVTELAPNRVVFSGRQGISEKGIGLLIGGDAKGFKLTRQAVGNVLDGILKIAEELDYDIFVTTSRRTTSEIDSFLKSRLKDLKRCKLLVIANEGNIEDAVPKILDMSEVVAVSQESVSMISEAVCSGKYVIVFKETGGVSKYEKVTANLENQGYIWTAVPDKIYDTMRQILKERPQMKKLEDRDKIIKRLGSII